MIDLHYPIGLFTFPQLVNPPMREEWIGAIASAPAKLRAAVAGLTQRQLDTPYRPGGWTVRQVVHHLPDSHMNAYIRCKLALTEATPTIKPYDEQAWAKLPDATLPIDPSLGLLDHLHHRWAALLRAVPESSWSLTCFHPGSQTEMSLDRLAGSYAWHGAHHVAHVTELRRREHW